ncbi:MAG TPA: LytTR family DNA-binding domain-containing protein [Bacteroidales bacterium]|nr:LytTR family DNA-binding domain-containing protein [Bacteroidales bacterium]
MKIVIVEDEKYTADMIIKLVKQYDPDIQLLAVLPDVESAVEWFSKNNAAPDLILMDVQLTDGDSFDIFNQVHIETPVVFITAYNEYAIKAFRVNSIDYILKPFDYRDIENALDKYYNLRSGFTKEDSQFYNNVFAGGFKQYKSRFLIKVGDYYKFLKTASVAYFLSEDGVVLSRLFERNGLQIVDESLDELEEVLDPAKFFRLNRKTIASVDAISGIQSYFNRRLIVRLLPDDRQEIVSRERVANFKKWMNF